MARSPRSDHLPGDVGRRAVIGEQVAFEDLNAAETGRRDRLQLFAQTAAQTNRGYRCFHFFVLRSDCFTERGFARIVTGGERTVKPGKIRRYAGEKAERLDRLMHAHAIPAENARTLC